MVVRGSVLRRSFLTSAIAVSATPLALGVAHSKVPVGLELYSVRDELSKDLMGTVRAVGKMGYKIVEFYAPYFSWTPESAREVRKLLDDIGVECRSTHNGPESFTGDGISKAIDLNKILGAKYVVLASAGRVNGLDGWKGVAEQLTRASEKLAPVGLRTGYHNHKTEFVPIDGKRPMEVIAANTPKDVLLQLDVGTCVEAGSDPVAWIKANPGRIRVMHCKDWGAGSGADRGYRVLFGEGDAPWAKIFAAAESVGGIEYYLIEQEGSRFPSLEGAEKCLENWKKFKA